MKTISSFCLPLLFAAAGAGHALGQVQLDWMTTHPGAGVGLNEHAVDAAMDRAGNAYLAVVTLGVPAGGTEIVKLSANGTSLWVQPLPAFFATDIEITPGGDVLVCGTGGGNVLVCYDSNGNPLWAQSPANASGPALAFDAQGNALMVGSAGGDMLVQAYSPAGVLLWDTRIDGPQHGFSDSAACVLVDRAGDIFVAGTVGTAYTDAAVAKLSAAGQLTWLSTWSASNRDEYFDSIASDGQGGVIVSGAVTFDWTGFPTITFINAHVARCDAAGNFLWHQWPWGIQAYDAAIDLLVDRTGVVWALIQDDIYSFSTPSIVVRRYGLNGSLLSEFSYDGPTHAGAVPGGLVLGSAGQVFVSGSLGNNFGSSTDRSVLLQMDSSGGLSWLQLFAGTGFGAMTNGGLLAAPNARLLSFGGAVLANGSLDGLALQFDVGDSPRGFCRAKLNSLGCTPVTGFTGLSSASANSGFVLRVQQIRNNTTGLFLYSLQGQAATPFGGGTLCLAGPILRSVPSVTGGTSAPAQDCSGVLTLDINAFAQGLRGGHPAPELTLAGSSVWVQAWSRDSGYPAPNNVSLSGGLRFVVLP